jgi:hypothetical protein
MQKKSHARIPAAWAWRNSRHVGPSRRGAGLRPARSRSRRTGPIVEYGGKTADSPEVQPMLCRLPPGESSPQVCTNCAPPTLSRTTSTGCSIPERSITTSSAPESARPAPRAAVPIDAITCAPPFDASRTAKRPDSAGGTGNQHSLAQNRTGGTQCAQRGEAGDRQRSHRGEVE